MLVLMISYLGGCKDGVPLVTGNYLLPHTKAYMRRSMKVKRWFLASNVIAFPVALVLASWAWAPIGEEFLPGGPGDGVIRVVFLFPLLVLMLLINMAWFVALVVSLKRDGLAVSKREIIIFAIVVLAWGSATFYDSSRQYRGDVVSRWHASDPIVASRLGQALRASVA